MPEVQEYFPYHKYVTAPVGGMTHVGGGKYVDSEGRSLSPEDRLPEIEKQIAALLAQKKLLDGKFDEAVKVVSEDVPAPDKPWEAWTRSELQAEHKRRFGVGSMASNAEMIAALSAPKGDGVPE